MFAPSASGINELLNQEETASAIYTALQSLKGSLQTGTPTLSSIQAAIAAAQYILNCGIDSDSAYFANLKSTLGPLVANLKQTPIVVQSCSKGGGTVQVKDSNGNGATVGSFDPKANYSWSDRISDSDDYRQTNWTSQSTSYWGGCDSGGMPYYDSDTSTSFGPGLTGGVDTHACHEYQDVHASGAGADVEKYAEVQMTAGDTQSAQAFLNAL